LLPRRMWGSFVMDYKRTFSLEKSVPHIPPECRQNFKWKMAVCTAV
jgi:hypothetical protein